ncbi:MAG: type II toxin-antitoxin system Phd/YefM family antitoxin [Anaerolineales bacterium]|nr:type II toxin-antitoxin system Phd/YefM family antitoxin [Anaerolineales bacterium]
MMQQVVKVEFPKTGDFSYGLVSHGEYQLDTKHINSCILDRLDRIIKTSIGVAMIENHWQLQYAKNKFSNLVEKAQHNGPQIVTKYGKDAVVVLSIDEYKKLIEPKINLIKFFQSSPLAKENLDFTRSKETPRDIEL